MYQIPYEHFINRPRYSPELDDASIDTTIMGNKDLGLISLQDYLYYTEYTFPYNENITSTELPEQDTDMIGEELRLFYMDEEDHVKMSGLFTIIRYDNDDPNVAILINASSKQVICTTTDKLEEEDDVYDEDTSYYVRNSYIHQIPAQHREVIGIRTRDYYYKDGQSNAGVVLRCDAGGDEIKGVIFEENALGYRVVTLKETKAIICLHDLDGDPYEDYWPFNDEEEEDNA